MLTVTVSAKFLLESNMIDVNSLDTIFVDDVMYLFDQNKPLSQIAYIMGCDEETVDQLICKMISENTSDCMDY